ncbi:MAG: phosphoribosyltransferase family protein [Phycisphaerae bacterium]|jgi:hypoxanthine phosphoribosyltransferase
MERQLTRTQIGRIILSESHLRTCINKLADQIKNAYTGCGEVIVLVLLNGAKRFADDLFERINDDKFKLRYISVSSYNGNKSIGKVTVQGEITGLSGCEVLIADDIYDTGLTLSEVVKIVEKEKPHGIRTCLLLEKQLPHQRHITIDFKGADVPDCFVVGYGLDHDEQFRELPYIAQYIPPRPN